MTKIYGTRAGDRKGIPEDITLCIEEVSERNSLAPRYYQCSRKRGYGEGGLYCKTHAKKHPAPETIENAKVAWLAEYKHRVPSLKRVLVLSQTSKQALIKRVEDEIGYMYVGDVIENDRLFFSRGEAIEYLTTKIKAHIENMKAEIATSLTELEKLGDDMVSTARA